MNTDFSELALEKMISHSLKYMTADVFGILIGTSTSVSDVIPVSHIPVNSCSLHIALDLILRTLNNDKFMKIVGIYDFIETFPMDDQAYGFQKSVLSSLTNLPRSDNMLYVKLQTSVESEKRPNNEQEKFSDEMKRFLRQKSHLSAEVFTFYEKKLESAKTISFTSTFIEKILANEKYLEINDIDMHLDDPKNDFMNLRFGN